MKEKSQLPPAWEGSDETAAAPLPRIRRADRQQVDPQPRRLDELIDLDHPARVVWAFVEELELSALYERIRAVEGHAGRSAIDARILLALWLYATLDGIGSARRLARLCQEHNAYRWLCGGVTVNYHTVSDFRVQHGAWLEEQLTLPVATLLAEGLVELKRTAQDGVRVRASAGAGSFRRRRTLEKCLAEAEAHLAALRREREENPAVVQKRRQAAQERAAREHQARIEAALTQLADVEAKKKAEAKEKARSSTTDPEARVMKMADGGFRPAYNGQFCTDTASQIIVGVEVSNAGNDQGQLVPMLDQVADHYGQYPDEALVDGGFVNQTDIDTLATPARDVTLYAPVPKPKAKERDPYQPLPTDSPAVAQWRQRMGGAAAKAIYPIRAATAECVNAIARNRGLQQFRVRGLKKVKAVLLWFALAHNLMRGAALRRQAAANPA
ncbi:MAG: IS1182 family transposase [Gammaproteobacteria bacterium]